MFGIIRRAIGPTLGRLRTRLDATYGIDLYSAELQLLTDTLAQLLLDRPRIQNAVTQLTSLNERWVNLINQNEPAQREQEDEFINSSQRETFYIHWIRP